MKSNFKANGYSVLIGSIPIDNHKEAAELVFRHTPEIPLWVQLPIYKEEGMIAQFLSGMPGLVHVDGKDFIDTGNGAFDNDLIKFYESYMAVEQGEIDILDTAFALTQEVASGFFELEKAIETTDNRPIAIKGQITGPITFMTSVKDQNGVAIFYNEQLRDAAVKLLALKAKWQVKKLSRFGHPVIIFLDEPALAGVGSSEFTTIANDEITVCLEEIIESIHAENGIAGIHVCANTDWPIILESKVDIVNFDSYSYFDRFILYPDQIKNFITSGGILAWGIVPTSSVEDIDRESVDLLFEKWNSQVGQLEKIGIERSLINSQSLITPSCGTGSLPLDNAIKVLEMTGALSKKIRSANEK